MAMDRDERWADERRTDAIRNQAAATDRLARQQGREADAQTRQAAALERIATVLEALVAPTPVTPPAETGTNQEDR